MSTWDVRDERAAGDFPCTFSAKGRGVHLQPGAAPQDSWHKKNASAESAIHFRPTSFDCWHHAPIANKVIVHIIFSTKDREPWLGLDVQPRMHAYLATVCRDLGAEVVRVGGVADHVHIVTTLPRTVS